MMTCPKCKSYLSHMKVVSISAKVTQTMKNGKEVLGNLTKIEADHVKHLCDNCGEEIVETPIEAYEGDGEATAITEKAIWTCPKCGCRKLTWYFDSAYGSQNIILTSNGYDYCSGTIVLDDCVSQPGVMFLACEDCGHKIPGCEDLEDFKHKLFENKGEKE